MTPIQIVTGVIGLISFLTSGFKLNHEAEVAAAIKAVERKTGLVHNIKWAWNWYDWRYKEELGTEDEVWDGNSFCHYADVTIKPWYDLGHWQDCLEKSLGRIQSYLQEAITQYEIEHPGEIGYQLQPWYYKYLPYGIMAGLGTALIISLARRK